MTDDFIYILICLVSVAFCSFISYTGSDSSASKFASSSILLAAIAIPLISAVSSLSEIDFAVPDEEYSGIYGEVAENTVEDAFCRGIKYAVSDKFSLDYDLIEVSCNFFDMNNMCAETVVITLSGKAVYADGVGIEKYIENEKFGECEVILNFEQNQ